VNPECAGVPEVVGVDAGGLRLDFYPSLTNRTRWLVLFTTLSLCVAACAGDESEPAASPSTEAATTEAPTTQSPTTQAPDAIEPDPSPDVVDSPAILTAYLGVLDLPAVGIGLLANVSGCEQQPLDEGMPVVLSHRVDTATLEPSDFVVTTAGGAAMTPTCATLEPATDDDELQTVLLTGPLGSSDDLPAEVAVVGELLAIDGTVLTGIATDTINTFETGPRLVLARLDPAGAQCAALGSSHEIQVTWEGGVSGPRGAEPGPAELEGLTLIDVDGGSHPLLGFDDLGDGDNYLVVCVPPDVEPATLEARRDTVYDPTNNPNPTTVVEVENRRSKQTTDG
jgi:hypothetical protein